MFFIKKIINHIKGMIFTQHPKTLNSLQNVTNIGKVLEFNLYFIICKVPAILCKKNKNIIL